LLDEGRQNGETHIYTSGWRAYGATVIAGPWKPNDEAGMKEAARLIYAAYKQGHPQHPVILMWVVKVLRGELQQSEIDAILPTITFHKWGEDVTLEVVKIAAQLGAVALPVLEQALQSKSYTVWTTAYTAVRQIIG